MRANYMEHSKELVRVKGIECEFIDIRIDRNTVPERKYFYEIRHSDEDGSEPAEIAKGILVNFFGTLISDAELPLNSDGRIYLEDGDFEYEQEELLWS